MMLNRRWHRQIDRWFAIWQAIHTGEWFESQNPIQKEQEASNLLPFRASEETPEDKGKPSGKQENFWTSAGEKTGRHSSRYCDTFGYTYADIQYTDKDKVKKEFGKKYEWSSYRFHKTITGPPDGMEPLDVSKAQVFQYREQQQRDEFERALLSYYGKPVTKGPADAALVSQEIPAVRQNMEAAPEGIDNVIKVDNNDESSGIQAGLAAPSDPDPVEKSAESRQWFVDQIVER